MWIEGSKFLRCYLRSFAISKLRAGVSAGLGGFVVFRQLPRRPGECNGTDEIGRPSGNGLPTTVTAEKLRSRRPDSLLARRAYAPLVLNRGSDADGVPHARASQDEATRVRANY